MLGWILPASGAAFVTAWTYHNSKFVGLPKLDRKYGIPTSIGLVILAWYMYKKEHMHVGHIPPIPRIHARAEANYAHNPAIVARQPLGASTGPGLDDLKNDVPESSQYIYPDNISHAYTHS
jgi:hypothetical protein